MPKKVNLPVLPRKPSIDAARTRLGGTAQGHALPPGLAPGVVVRFGPDDDERGVVIFASIIEVHVLLDPSRMRRFPPAELEVHQGAHAFEELATDAKIFGMLHDGQAIRYAVDGGTMIDGIVAEKCRWGAIITRDDDDIVVAVGFRKLWPRASADLA